MTIFDRPSSSELLKAVIDFVDAETRSDDYPANKRFKLQIVSNVLNIVKREIDLGKKINDDFILLGAKLIKDKDFSISKLADKIKNNEIDVSDQNFIDFLYDLTEKKIDIDNPKYKKNWYFPNLYNEVILVIIYKWNKKF